MKLDPSKKTNTDESEPIDFVAEERGQISIFLLLGIIPLVFLIALIFNTATQTSKKIQMQGAADAGVLSGAVWQARGMNLIVLNNNSMAEILSIMIVVRALERTGTFMPVITAPLHVPPFTPIAVDSDKGSIILLSFAKTADTILNRRNGIGWQALKILDRFNRIIRDVMPAIALFENYNYAKENGASLALMITSNSFSLSSVNDISNGKNRIQGMDKTINGFKSLAPLLPIARNLPKFLAIRATECQLSLGSTIRNLGRIILLFCYQISYLIALALYDFLIEMNLANLSGGENRSIMDKTVNLIRKAIRETLGFIGDIPIIGDILKKALNAAFSAALRIIRGALGLLQWDSSNPPMPMLLSENPGRANPNKKEEEIDLKKVRKYLQYLSLSFNEREEKSPIGGRTFLNESAIFLPNTQLTYAQAEVYNPTKWSMFSQDWRAKLSKATILNEKFTDWSFVNNH